MTTLWTGKVGPCNGCNKRLDNALSFYDAKHPCGAWGLFCESCFNDFDGRLGVGWGQRYLRAQDGTYERVVAGTLW